MELQQLKDRNVKSVNLNGIEYFDVKDIKDNHPDLKVDIKKIILIRKNVYITAENIQEITDFDKVFKGLFKA
ncbi:hypothetical protein [Chryseobacterium cheonjiense]|uniref:Uncharacterized protein n=1 Tax=Chryseobacterium cheonjiense TaxID=2728845 RepID=A0A7Y0A3E7_9FLAO|nr:hypothetical protein [Chryseobacterium cheonjiense]NML55851.1 hypothetical protein [Chryseobacterium cheonjiense]